MVDGVRAAVGANGVATTDGVVMAGDHDRAASGWISFSPAHGEWVDPRLAGVGG